MTGWKTKSGALMALLGAALGVWEGTVSLPEGIMVIGAALGTLGIGHKLEKYGDAKVK